MSKGIIKYSDFQPDIEIEESPVINEGVEDYIIKGLGLLGDGFGNMVKQKVIAYLLEFLKIKEKSPISKLFQEIFEEIDVDEYYGIISGKYSNWDFFIPKIADGLIGFLQRSGFDEIAESLGIESDGYLYSTIREAIEESLSKKQNLKKSIESFLKKMLKGKNPGESVDLKGLAKDMDSSNNGKKLIDKINKKVIPHTGLGNGGNKEKSVMGYIEDLLGSNSNTSKLAKALTN